MVATKCVLQEDWNERVAGEDESDHIPAKSERAKRAASSGK